MRGLACFLLLASVLGLASAAIKCEIKKDDDTYTTRYDHVDVDAILNSGRLLKSYVDCLLERGACNQEGCFLREVLPDALSSNCSKCSEVQKLQAGKILSFLLQYHRKDYWPLLLAKFDPDGTFRKEHEFEDDEEED